ncbi:transglycosylase domain-containing protein [Wenjunlia vitaminophila]|uniref:Transglycosylase domain-containing protein n=1 Tax=Wenjunlia vitaminophila TaxID=76728 RepID=A0A0T6LLY5_WENVI|nr:transglycosylase domain-containing protein [Wenjunlia vitaminophila]
MTRISVRGFAVASATAVTAVGAVVGVASGSEQGETAQAGDPLGSTLLADIPSGDQAQQVVSVNLTQQAQAQADVADAAAKRSAEESARKHAANQAAAKKAAAEEAAAKKRAEELAAKRAEEQEAASRSAERATFPTKSSYTVAEVQEMARQIVGGDQFQCFSNIVDHESGWNYQAVNPSSGAYGLVQALPGSKMASAGADWQTNPATQIKWGLSYMNERYGSPCGAWSFWQANHWY